MKKKSKIKTLSSPRLRILQKDLEKIQKAEKYLEKEFGKLKKEKEKFRKKIKKEKEILKLRNKIKFLKKRK
jgi:predicted  nucleic acid-binding Zn-ribbon protein